MESSEENGPILIDTSKNFDASKDVNSHMAMERARIRTRFEKIFDGLPEMDRQFSLDRHMSNHPEAVILVPQKDLNMFPIVIDEAKFFMGKRGYDANRRLNQVREHEFEHIQKVYELGIDVGGIALVALKRKGRPAFAGLVAAAKDQEISLRDQLRIRLAPKTLALRNEADIRECNALILDALAHTKTYQELSGVLADVLFVISERFLPKRVHSFVEDIKK